jgi:hypothetical protein
MDPSIVDRFREDPEYLKKQEETAKANAQQEETTKYKSIDNYISIFNQEFLKTLSGKLNSILVNK